MSDTNSNNSQTQSIADYLAQLLKDRNKVNAFPNVFIHVERLIDEEITRVRSSLFQVNGVKKEPLVLPDPAGEPITLTEKVFVPVKDHPEFNFVGRILGPRGMTAKQLELETGCKIMVRGKGSMRDKKKEEQNRGKPNWEHLNEELHVLISVEDTENRAKIKMQRAIEEVKKLIIPADGEDELKKRQLMELAIINGTYRDSESMRALAAAGNEFVIDEVRQKQRSVWDEKVYFSKNLSNLKPTAPDFIPSKSSMSNSSTQRSPSETDHLRVLRESDILEKDSLYGNVDGGSDLEFEVVSYEHSSWTKSKSVSNFSHKMSQTWQSEQSDMDTLNYFDPDEDSISISALEKRREIDDACSQFFTSLVPYFKSLSSTSKMRCGIEIQVVFLKYLYKDNVACIIK
ncbi:protein quaking-B isoform X3 [Planococcus citri]|uniref:protein quaking-B isoform X3 n=1 Tax=Planococcus citri TaxID=170843 RepID=UPI0031F82E3B